MDTRMSSPHQSISPREDWSPDSPRSEVSSQGITPAIAASFFDAVDKAEGHPNLIVICGTRTWRVHHSVVCFRSTYFETACESDDEDDSRREYRYAKHEVELSEDEDPDMVTRMLTWCYHRDHPSPPENEDTEKPSLGQKVVIDTKLHIIAEKYGFENLKFEASTRVSRNLAQVLEDIFKDDKQSNEISHVVKAIKLAFATRHDVLQKSVLHALQHYHESLMSLAEFQQLVMDGGEFAFAILANWTTAINNREFVCSKCAFKPKYQYAKSRQDMECSCCTKKFGAYLRFSKL